MKKITILTMIIGAAFGLSACSFEFSTNGNTASNANANKPTNAANSASNSANANKASTTSSTNSSKTEMKDEKAQKPTNTKKQPNAATVPAEWIYYADEQRGYGFSLPTGSVEGEKGTTDGVDYFSAETPQKISIIVYAFKDATLTKEDLLDRAEKALNAMGETIKAGELKGESDDYAVADGTSESKDGTKSNLKVLVATDVTDNYVMIVRSAAADYEKNKATMDMIWGSFEMYSGGASGNN